MAGLGWGAGGGGRGPANSIPVFLLMVCMFVLGGDTLSTIQGPKPVPGSSIRKDAV